jgi:hypothetical protein
VENRSHLLWFLTTRYLGSRDYLKELLPEWTKTDEIRVALQLLGGAQVEYVFTLPVDVSKLVGVESQIALPEPDESGIAFDLIGDENEIGFLRIDHMKHYRERFELRASFGMETLSEDDLRAIPSATEFFRSAAVAMKEAGCEALIVDLRENDGGEATMADILMYFLYGKATTESTRTNTITKVSKAYLEAREHVTLDALNRNRDVALVEGDYDFSDDHTSGILGRASSMDEAFARSPTFFGEWSSGTYESYYRPDRVMVLVGPQTFSAGFLLALRMYLAGAELVGTPPSSAPNSAGNMTGWSLTKSGITGWVSQSYALNFPDETGIGRELPVHHALTLELLRHYDYDPNAEVLYALDLLHSIERQD